MFLDDSDNSTHMLGQSLQMFLELLLLVSVSVLADVVTDGLSLTAIHFLFRFLLALTHLDQLYWNLVAPPFRSKIINH